MWKFCRDEVNDDDNENNDVDYRINNNKKKTCKSFEYKTKLIESTPVDNNTLDREIVVPLKNLSNFWRLFELPLINRRIEIDLRWTTFCIISEISRIKVLENMKQGFKRTDSWNKYKSEITKQPKNSNLDYVIDQASSRNINRFFVLQGLQMILQVLHDIGRNLRF